MSRDDQRTEGWVTAASIWRSPIHDRTWMCNWENGGSIIDGIAAGTLRACKEASVRVMVTPGQRYEWVKDDISDGRTLYVWDDMGDGLRAEQ